MKNYCKHCGAKLDPVEEHICPKRKVWTKIKNLWNEVFGTKEIKNDDHDYYEREKAIVPDSIEADNGEIVVKQYDLAILRSRLKLTRAEGRMQITNKRLLFRATGKSPAGKTVYQNEFSMDKIDGVEIRKDYRFMFLDFVLNTLIAFPVMGMGVLLGLLFNQADNIFVTFLTFLFGTCALIPFFVIRKQYLLKLTILSFGQGLLSMAMVAGIMLDSKFLIVLSILSIVFNYVLYWISMFLSFFKPNLMVEIKTSGGTPGVQIKHKYASFFLWKKMEENSGFSEILPGKDADLAIKEVGALINDIKTLGDLGVEKWQDDAFKAPKRVRINYGDDD